MKQFISLLFILSFGLNAWAQTTEKAPDEELPEVEARSWNVYNDNFGYGGFTLGLPGIVNLNLGGFGGPFGISCSFSALHLIQAVVDKNKDQQGQITDDDDSFFFTGQLNVDLKLVATEDFLLSATLAGGSAIYSGENTTSDLRLFYYGPGGHLFYKSFFLEGGWGYGYDASEKKKVQFPLFQIGFIGRF